jgi:hypothetical protein
MPTIELSDEEFSQLMFVMANAEGKGLNWQLVNPLMMRIGTQARLQAEAQQRRNALLSSTAPAPPPGNGQKEVRHE